MKNTYFDLIDQSYSFPQEGFEIHDNFLKFSGISLKKLIEKHGTPFRLVYLPKIREQIQRAKDLFNTAIKKNKYKGNYYYCYCTKCNHFAPVIKTALKESVHIETSSSYDINLIRQLLKEGAITKSIMAIHNGYKTDNYIKKILSLQASGFDHSIIVLDSVSEFFKLKEAIKGSEAKIKLGIRMAINEEPQSTYHTSRLGIRESAIMRLFKEEIQNSEQFELKMLHFFVDSGIKDSLYYWGEFHRALNLYTLLKKESPSLNALNIGGGFPIKNNLGFNYDYETIVNKIIGNIKQACTDENIEDPDIITEFGKYTVGESGAIIFSVLEQKQQNDKELWYMIDNSLINTIPDAWSNYEKFILLPINKWNNKYTQVNIGGLSCDHTDYYNSEDMNEQTTLPTYKDSEPEPLYLGFFHTGAYQDSISGYGGIKHCLIPSPKYILIDRDENGNLNDTIYRQEQSVEDMLSILGYNIENTSNK